MFRRVHISIAKTVPSCQYYAIFISFVLYSKLLSFVILEYCFHSSILYLFRYKSDVQFRELPLSVRCASEIRVAVCNVERSSQLEYKTGFEPLIVGYLQKAQVSEVRLSGRGPIYTVPSCEYFGCI